MPSPAPGEAIRRDEHGATTAASSPADERSAGASAPTVRDAAQITRVVGG